MQDELSPKDLQELKEEIKSAIEKQLDSVVWVVKYKKRSLLGSHYMTVKFRDAAKAVAFEEGLPKKAEAKLMAVWAHDDLAEGTPL